MDDHLIESSSLVGAISSIAYFLCIIAVFAFRLAGKTKVSRRIGLASTLIVVPLIYLFVSAFRTNPPSIYYFWVGLAIVFVIVELLVDYTFKIEFRAIKWATILYVVAFFAATGGMIGIARQAGERWTIAAGVIFIVMGILAFFQRKKTRL
jgi:hypothetical protein